MFQTTAKAKGEVMDPVKLVKDPSNLLLTVPMLYFSCRSSMLHVFFPYTFGLEHYSQLPIIVPVLFRFVI